jgi:hypothetical protein
MLLPEISSREMSQIEGTTILLFGRAALTRHEFAESALKVIRSDRSLQTPFGFALLLTLSQHPLFADKVFELIKRIITDFQFELLMEKEYCGSHSPSPFLPALLRSL